MFTLKDLEKIQDKYDTEGEVRLELYHDMSKLSNKQLGDYNKLGKLISSKAGDYPNLEITTSTVLVTSYDLAGMDIVAKEQGFYLKAKSDGNTFTTESVTFMLQYLKMLNDSIK